MEAVESRRKKGGAAGCKMNKHFKIRKELERSRIRRKHGRKLVLCIWDFKLLLAKE